MKTVLRGCMIVALLASAGFAASDFAADPAGERTLNWMRYVYDAVTGQDRGMMRDYVGVKNPTKGVTEADIAAQRKRSGTVKHRAANQAKLTPTGPADLRRKSSNRTAETARVSRSKSRTTGTTASNKTKWLATPQSRRSTGDAKASSKGG